MKKGFTLIELLIVVAIVGILASIAGANYLNAQVRAKLSRNMADLRSIFYSVEEMRLDTGYLPIDVWDHQTKEGRIILQEQFHNIGDAPANQRSADMILAVLTSPTPYLSAIPSDPFLSKAKDNTQRGFEAPLTTYVYADEDPKIPGDDLFYFAFQHPNEHSCCLRSVNLGEYAIIGVGPDGILGNKTVAEDNKLRGLPYDSSNGLMSVGDIYIRESACFNK